MPVTDKKIQIRTITCDACEKTVTFDMDQHQEALKDNPWMNTTRLVQSGDGRPFLYCSDSCEVTGAGTGNHYIPEPKKIIETPQVGAAQAIKIAAEAAKQAREGTAAIKAGRPTNLKIVKS